MLQGRSWNASCTAPGVHGAPETLLGHSSDRRFPYTFNPRIGDFPYFLMVGSTIYLSFLPSGSHAKSKGNRRSEYQIVW